MVAQHHAQMVKRFANHKITSIVFFLGILFDIHFVSFKCEGAIFLDGSKTRVVLPGSDVEIKWTFDDDIDKLVVRIWGYDGRALASIIRKGTLEKTNSSLSRIEFKEKGTMVLRNVDDSYNGTYSFHVTVAVSLYDISFVDVFVAEKPTITINCSSVTNVDEGKDLTCVCKGEGGNPPANVTWYKDCVQIGDGGNEQKLLTLSNVNETTLGTYTCVAQSYVLKEEKSIEVLVPFPPRETKLTFTPASGICSEIVIIQCEAEGHPQPTYQILYGNRIVSTKKTYVIKVDDINTGLYTCITKNVLGTDSVSRNFTFSAGKTDTTKTPISTNSGTEKASSNKVNGGSVVVWHIVVSLVAGFITGFLFSYLVTWSRRRFRKRTPRSKAEPQTPKDNTIYQDLDLRKMNSEDNYQSLRGNYTKDDAGPEQDSTYTELSKTREDEDNYQTLS